MKKGKRVRPTADEIVRGMRCAIDRDRRGWATLEGKLTTMASDRGITVGDLSGDFRLDGVVLTYGEEVLVHRAFLEVMARLRIEDPPAFFPGLLMGWRGNHVVYDLDVAFFDNAFSVEEEVLRRPLSLVEGLFPGCVAIQALPYAVGYPDHVPLAALFAWATYDVSEGCEVLLVAGRGTDGSWSRARVPLVGETVADALGAMGAEAVGAPPGLAASLPEGSRADPYFRNSANDPGLALAALGLLAAVGSRRDGACGGVGSTGDAPVSVGAADEVHDAAVPAAPGSPPSAPDGDGDPGRSEEAPGESELAALRGRIEEMAGRYDRDIAAAERERAAVVHGLERASKSAERLRRENEDLAARLSFFRSFSIPRTPLEALEAAVAAYGDRLAATESALKSAEGFRRGDAAEVWDVLRSMAFELHDLLFGEFEGDLAAEFRNRTGFELALRDPKSTSQNPGCARLRTAVYKGREYDMTPHVKGRSDRPGEALRAHFFADYEEKKVVVGHCGAHLKTTGDRRLR